MEDFSSPPGKICKNGGFFVTTRKNMEKMEDFSEENSQRFYEVIHDMPL